MIKKSILRNVAIVIACLAAVTMFSNCSKDKDKDGEGGGTTNTIGDGSETYPFLVANVADLKRVGTGEETQGGKWKLDKHYKQIADIDLSGEDNLKSIGGVYDFTGTYDGGGYTISNLTIVRGLFSYVQGTVKNVRLNGVNISGNASVGSVAGSSKGVIEHCSVSNVTVSGNFQIGGLVGLNTGSINACIVSDGTVICSADGELFNGSYSGGVAGRNLGTITNCYTTVDVTGTQMVGGIVGVDGTVQYCYSTGNINGDDEYIGGITGFTLGKISNCVALNSKVKNTSAPSSSIPDIGRVIGWVSNVYTSYNNNYARPDMILIGGENPISLGTEATITGMHGANVESADYHGANSGTWWSNTAEFPTSEWLFDNNRLPRLKGFEGLVQNPKVN